MATITDLDDATIAHIIALLGGPHFALALRGACRELRARVRAPAHRCANTVLREAARDGDWRLCLLARRAGAEDVSTMLCAAAIGGHRELCELAIEWGARNFEEMRLFANIGGYHDMRLFPGVKDAWYFTIDSHLLRMFKRPQQTHPDIRMFCIPSTNNSYYRRSMYFSHMSYPRKEIKSLESLEK